MTTLAKATGGTSGHPSTRRKPYYVENTIDFSVDDPAANDIVQFLNIPAETCVMAAGLEVLTASASGVTLDLGWTATSGNLATDIDRFVDGHDSTSTGIAAVAAATASIAAPITAASINLRPFVAFANLTNPKLKTIRAPPIAAKPSDPNKT